MKKTLLLIITLLIFAQVIFAQEKPIVFENDRTAYYNKSGIEYFEHLTFCKLYINKDSTFRFYSQPDVSCFTWRKIEGNWNKIKDTYTFYNQYEVREDNSRVSFNKDSIKRYLMRFRTDKKSELKNRSIKIKYIYDYYAELDDLEIIINLNQDDAIEIPFIKIPNLDKLSSISAEYQLNDKKLYGYISQNKISNLREKEIPNIVEVVFVEIPKTEIVYRTTIGKLNGSKLEIISSVKTKTDLPEYLPEIGFEKYYKLRK